MPRGPDGMPPGGKVNLNIRKLGLEDEVRKAVRHLQQVGAEAPTRHGWSATNVVREAVKLGLPLLLKREPAKPRQPPNVSRGVVGGPPPSRVPNWRAQADAAAAMHPAHRPSYRTACEIRNWIVTDGYRHSAKYGTQLEQLEHSAEALIRGLALDPHGSDALRLSEQAARLQRRMGSLRALIEMDP